MSWKTLSLVCLLSIVASACAATPAAPFDTLKDANVTAYRLHPVKPPPPAPAAQPGAVPIIPGIPPEVQQWAQQAAPALQQILPPGLLPPGLIPGAPQQPAPQADPLLQAPRFHEFPIVQSVPVISADLKEDLADVMGQEDNFQAQHFNCMHAEFGISFSTTPGAPPNDVLISLSCNQMQGHNFVWPHGKTGLTPETVKALSQLLPQIFPNTGAPAVASANSPNLVML